MKIYQLLKNVKCRVLGSVLKEVTGLYHNHDRVEKDGMFFCLKGTEMNGEDFALKAIRNGAVAIVVENELRFINNVTQILVKDARVAMSLIAQNYYGNPAKSLKLIGVTGTNGKTSTTYMIAGLIKSLNHEVAIIGTNGVVYNDQKLMDTGMTTPDPIELHKILQKLKKMKIEYVCMEISAHSLYLKKIDGLRFEVAIFSNLTEDHLDFFQSMEKYYMAKKVLFSNKYTKKALINVDDLFGMRLYKSINLSVKTYSIDSASDYKAEDLGMDNFEQKMRFGEFVFYSKFIGKFNIYNLTAALACLDVLNLCVKDVQESVNSIVQIPGRFNTLVIKNKLFIIDYAHTPDGLENVLLLSKKISKEKRLVCVFGCGGNRETQKRQKMGEISSKIANFTIITNDNPRFENPMDIAKEIEKGVIGDNYKIILDRKSAINYADTLSRCGDVILIAGKGAESYIEENGKMLSYSDFEEVEKLRR